MNATLNPQFVFSEKVERIIALGYRTAKNVLLWGPAGHGKSEMATHFLSRHSGLNSPPFTLSFGEGMDEAALWGGLDFRALEEDKILQYQPERSFLAQETAIFEEIFDAPASVLLALKDALTARSLRKGAQVYPMQTRCIVACTNTSPDEVSALGPACHALIERFPLQLKVEWETYSKDSFLALFAAVLPSLPTDRAEILAESIAAAIAKGAVVSPRSAIHAAQIALHAQTPQWWEDLEFVPGFGGEFARSCTELQDRIIQEAKGKTLILDIHQWINEASKALPTITSPIPALQMAKKAQEWAKMLNDTAIPDALQNARQNERNGLGEVEKTALARALACTRLPGEGKK